MAAVPEDSRRRRSLIPNFLYTSPTAAAAPSERIEMFSPAYYAACAVGGLASCGFTHAAVTPLDVVKCNMQIDPARFKSTGSTVGIVLKEQGIRGLFKGWAPTFVGYSAQGAFKYGLYEYFKKEYSDMVGPAAAGKYKTLIYLAGSASAEVIADVALCPFEAVKVRVQTQPEFARSLADGLPKIVRAQGVSGLFRGVVPLWGRQIPYTMMKFATFENIVEAMYKHVIPTRKEECSKGVQLGVSFAGGYIAGVFCAVVSHPADNLVSFFNNAAGATVADAVKKLGIWGLCTRGLPLRIVMVGTLTGAQWGIYDSSKVFFGLPTTGGGSSATAVN
ncbi:mitochondrial phosphate carrier protein 2, mitochondrial-like [Andrographis paniculata]|uniref:mitochondrial phosphate carrier protein 2, mitochondrial-like n=1 Tax=Andrographis paniculata TaxID=175694 RepID=UPI0021E7A5D9|nr:mitochondrial phosphate carrier protein 2, mitochondrial-like [Andrographis paniculata]